MAWVTNDGEYNGSSLVLEFDYDDLTSEQWEKLENMSDDSRYDYVEAILNNNPNIVRLIEQQNFE